MPYTPSDVKAMIAAGESQTVEFKARLHDSRMLARIISAFGNAEGGVVLVGVGDRGEIVGADVNEVSRVLRHALSEIVAAPRVEARTVALEGRQVATITVPKARGVVVSGDGAYIRAGEELQVLSAEASATLLRAQVSDPAQLDRIAVAIHRLTERIEQLQREQVATNSVRGQMRNYIIGGIIGAVLGVLLSRMLG